MTHYNHWLWPLAEGVKVTEIPFERAVDVEDLKRRYAEVVRQNLEAEKAMLKRRP
jgi:hypothetical protein